MLNRRLIRIKVFQSLYSWSQDEQADRTFYLRQLQTSIRKVYEFYYFILALPVDLKHVVELELETQLAKHFPSEEEIMLHRALIANTYITLLATHPDFTQKLAQAGVNWEPYHDFIRQFFQELKKDDVFKVYALKPNKTQADDRKVLQHLINKLSEENELFNHQMEELHINWQDDKVVLMNAVNKSMRMLKDATSQFLSVPDEEYQELESFSKELYSKTLMHEAELATLIGDKTKNWDVERIAMTDVLLMKMAVAEMLYFPSIPVKVTINEYLEISKLYSTPNSKNFINGVLDGLQKDFRAENKLHKEGRGLIE